MGDDRMSKEFVFCEYKYSQALGFIIIIDVKKYFSLNCFVWGKCLSEDKQI